MENRLFAYFDFNPTKAYPLVTGATYTETFNEEINSFNIVLDDISEEDRIYFDRPYHFVKIVNDIPDGETGLLFNGKNYVIMLVDTFVENLNCIGDEKIYRYEIGLMNCIKLLEKIQCPNLMITHSLTNEENEPIYVYIDRYMKLYSPKMKISTDGETWNYEYLLNWDNILTDPLFNISAADMQMNEPTLREVITNLMSQVGCIPSCDFRTLTYINLREEPSNANITDADGINFIKHSGASDSFASDLISSPSQALQEKNTVVADIVGFRDSDNAIIQQTKNLQLEVRYPIYKINEVRMRTTDTKYGWIKPVNQNAGNSVPVIMGRTTSTSTINTYKPFIEYEGTNGLDEDYWRINVNLIFAQLLTDNIFHKGRIYGLQVHFFKYENDSFNEVLTIGTGTTFYDIDLGDVSEENSISLSSNKGFQLGSSIEDSTYRISINGFRTCNYRYRRQNVITTMSQTGGNFTQIATHGWVEFYYEDAETSEVTHHFAPMAQIKQRTQNSIYYIDVKTSISTGVLGLYTNNNELSFDTLYPSSEITMNKLTIPANIGTYINITDCIVENGKRRLLEVDYTLMQNIINDTNKDLKDLAQYIYGTMGYSIGDTKITGFSKTYTRAQMWWSWTDSYFDTILSFINTRKQRLQDFDWPEFLRVMEKEIADYKSEYGYDWLNIPIDQAFYIDLSGSTWDTNYNKMKFLFYIYYQPLNNFKFKATKEGKDFPHAIEQLNNTASGLSDFERVVKNLQDTTNRIGNPVKVLPQTTDDLNDIKPLNSIYNDGYYDFTIFHRQFAIYEDYIDVNYTASENYVIKNYFTSIITKYRAYEYVDYNASVVRKENTKVYAYISDKHYYDGDDKLRLFNEFYSFDDLKRILGVNDLSNYINFSSDGTNYYTLIKDYKIRFFWNVYGEGHSYNFGKWFDIIFSLDTEVNIICNYSSTADQSYTKNQRIWKAYYNSITYPKLKDTGQAWLKRGFEKYSEQYRREINTTVEEIAPSYFINYINLSKYNILSKMDGSILKDEILNKYYKIHVSTYDDLTETLISNFPLQQYEDIYNLFNRVNNYLKTMPYSHYNNDSWEFYENNNLISIRADDAKINIYLEEITDPLEIDEIINNQEYKLTMLLSGLTIYDETYSYQAKYCIKSSQNQYGNTEETKNEINTLSYNIGFAIYYQDYDNVSAGPQLLSINKETSPSSPAGVGGYIQKWQVWDQNVYGESHQVFFTYQINIKDDAANIDSYIAQLPVINKGWEYQPYTLFQIVDNNKSSDLRFTFYKDNAEIINQTLQIEYYGDDLIVGKYFIEHNRIIGRLGNLRENSELMEGMDITGEKFELNEEVYETLGISIGNSNPIDVGFDPVENKAYIDVEWSTIIPSVKQFKIVYCYWDSDEQKFVSCHDMIAFKRNGRTEDTRYYLTLNDTKTNDVWYFSDPDDLFEIRECKNGLERKLKDI